MLRAARPPEARSCRCPERPRQCARRVAPTARGAGPLRTGSAGTARAPARPQWPGQHAAGVRTPGRSFGRLRQRARARWRLCARLERPGQYADGAESPSRGPAGIPACAVDPAGTSGCQFQRRAGAAVDGRLRTRLDQARTALGPAVLAQPAARVRAAAVARPDRAGGTHGAAACRAGLRRYAAVLPICAQGGRARPSGGVRSAAGPARFARAAARCRGPGDPRRSPAGLRCALPTAQPADGHGDSPGQHPADAAVPGRRSAQGGAVGAAPWRAQACADRAGLAGQRQPRQRPQPVDRPGPAGAAAGCRCRFCQPAAAGARTRPRADGRTGEPARPGRGIARFFRYRGAGCKP